MINSEQFSKLFVQGDEKDLVPFNEEGVVGFSILKNYPEVGLLFKPIKNQNGGFDTVALIKIYAVISEKREDNKIPINIWIGPVSGYLLKGKFRYDYKDLESPTAESVSAWEKSVKPIELIENEYSLNLENNKVLDKSGTIIDSKKVIERIFGEHMKTVRRFAGMPFRIKLNTKNFVVYSLSKIFKLIYLINERIFSREIITDTQSLDGPMYKAFLKPAPLKLFKIPQGRLIRISSIEIPVSKWSAIVTAFLLVLVGILDYLYSPSIFNLLMDLLSKSTEIVGVSTLTIWILIYDYLLPMSLFLLSNLLIILANLVASIRIKI